MMLCVYSSDRFGDVQVQGDSDARRGQLMTTPETYTKFGKFALASDKELWGELDVAGKYSLLYVRDDEKFEPYVSSDACITGVLQDRTRVTLLKCINLTGLGYDSRNNEPSITLRYFLTLSLKDNDFWDQTRGQFPKSPSNLKTVPICFMTLTRSEVSSTRVLILNKLQRRMG